MTRAGTVSSGCAGPLNPFDPPPVRADTLLREIWGAFKLPIGSMAGLHLVASTTRRADPFGMWGQCATTFVKGPAASSYLSAAC